MTSKSIRKVQYFAGVSVCAGYVQAGALIAWVSPAIVKLKNGETDLILTKPQESWIVSLQVLCVVLGCFGGQVMLEKIGRKWTMLAAALPAFISSIMIMVAKSAELMYVVRLLQGVSIGITSLATIIYISEITDKEIRGPLGMWGQVSLNLGYLLMYAVGPFVTYTVLAVILLILPVVFVLAAFWIPESPYYYLMKGRYEEAKQVFVLIKGTENASVDQQLEIMKSSVAQSMQNKGSMTELFTKKKYRRALCVVAGLRIIQFMTGFIAIMTYLQVMFKGRGPIISIVYGVLQLIASLAGSFLSRWVGRRPLMLTSCLGVAVSLTIAGTYFYLQHSDQTSQSLTALSLIGILGFNIFYMIGIGTLPNVMQAELFPINVKSQASSANTIFACLLSFFVAKYYQYLKDMFGQHIVFWIFAGVAYGGVIFIYIYLPETQGKTLEEVHQKMEFNTEVKALKSNIAD